MGGARAIEGGRDRLPGGGMLWEEPELPGRRVGMLWEEPELPGRRVGGTGSQSVACCGRSQSARATRKEGGRDRLLGGGMLWEETELPGRRVGGTGSQGEACCGRSRKQKYIE